MVSCVVTETDHDVSAAYVTTPPSHFVGGQMQFFSDRIEIMDGRDLDTRSPWRKYAARGVKDIRPMSGRLVPEKSQLGARGFSEPVKSSSKPCPRFDFGGMLPHQQCREQTFGVSRNARPMRPEQVACFDGDTENGIGQLPRHMTRRCKMRMRPSCRSSIRETSTRRQILRTAHGPPRLSIRRRPVGGQGQRPDQVWRAVLRDRSLA